MKTIYRVTEAESQEDDFWEKLDRYKFFPTKAQALSYAKNLKLEMQHAIDNYENQEEERGCGLWSSTHPLSEFLTGEYEIKVCKVVFSSNIDRETLCWVAGGALLTNPRGPRIEKIWEHTFTRSNNERT